MLGDARHQVLFVGYQGAGVTTISGYSAHADQQGLLRFIKQMRHWPRVVHLVHGDAAARLVLKDAIEALAARHQKAITVQLPENQPTD